MGVLRTDRVSGLGGANAINGSVKFSTNRLLEVHGAESNEDFRLSNGSFTIEFWANVTDTTNSTFVGLFENNPARRSWMFEIRSSQALRFEWWTDGSSGSNLTSSTGIVSLDTWHHYAVVRNGTALNIYVDGTSVANTTTSDTLYENTIEPLTIGGIYQVGALTQDINGHVSNLRIIKGEAIYTANFTVPTTRLEKTTNTVLLCCQSPGDVTQEATDKTIVPITTSTADAPPMASHFVPDVGEDHGTTFGENTVFDTLSYMVPPGGTTTQSNRGRGLLMGGAVSPGSTNTTQIKYFDIASQGITDDFGQTSVARRATGSLSSSTRAVMGGGFVAPPSPYTISDVMDYVTIATTANAIDFGNMQSTAYHYATASNETRGLFAGGYRPNNSAVVNTIDLITIATTGNASNFGDLTRTARSFGGAGSTTRGVFFGGTHPAIQDVIDYVTFSTTGDATDFGNLTDARDNAYGASSSTRAVMAGGRDPNTTNIIDYITIASTGDATDFGDLTQTSYYFNASTSNSIRAVWVGTSTIVNSMEYVTIATTGNSVDWGDQGGTIQHSGGACSDSHGGIS